ncbi:MAG: malto-oligosyltrehalose trehalohydrolase [Acidobacteriota bacterium]
MKSPNRRRPFGAEIHDDATHFRVWAPERKQVTVVLHDRELPLTANAGGIFEGSAENAGAGALYHFRLDDDEKRYPDPASRYQPQGPHGPSQVVDPSIFPWTDAGWRGVTAAGQVLYEIHVGTLTAEGTWTAAARHLQRLYDLGITLVEVMPIHEFPGLFGWGYDGVDLWAPVHLYGTPDDFRTFVDTAHAIGIGVILDVVYNHLGPDGNYLPAFSPHYFNDLPNDWGQTVNFDGEQSGPVRDFFAHNAGYWIEEFHLDGLRLDATQAIRDESDEHVLAMMVRSAREAAGTRSLFIAAENEPQDVRLFDYGIDALCNDDFHHSAMVALTGHNEAYYLDYHGTPQELISSAKWGFLFQGQRYSWQKQRRGTVSRGVAAHRFICYLENHDQVANSADGSRVRTRTSPGRYRALSALLLLGPWTPMLFQGQEAGATTPFHYFADHDAQLGPLVEEGRREFLRQFPSLAGPEVQSRIPKPHDPGVFAANKLDERDDDPRYARLYRDLLALRRDPRFARQRADLLDGAVLSAEAFLLRFFDDDGDDRLLLVNLGRDLRLDPAPEPLLAPPPGRTWELAWSSESPHYGGGGTPTVEKDGGWFLPGESAVVLRGS